MTDTPALTPGSEWLLPVTFDERLRQGLGRFVIPCGIDIMLTNADVYTLIPASRLADLEAEVARWQQLYEDARHDLTKAEMEVEKLQAIDERLSDNKRLEDFVYHIFYANPIENARVNLVLAIQRYLRGEPLVTEDEAQRAKLDAMTPEDRAAWWRNRNAEILK
jgi:hypothetical protein